MATTASFVIDFGSDEAIVLSAELDSDRNGGKSSFAAGEEVFFRVYHTAGIPYEASPSVGPGTRYEIVPSSGSIVNIATAEIEAIESEILSFVQQKTANTSKLIIGDPTSVLWYDADGGNNYGNITRSGEQLVSAEVADANSVGISAINYNTQYDVFKLTPPAGMSSTYHIVVLIKVVES